MASPVITTNTLAPSTVLPGGSTTWTTVAQDPDARVAVVSRMVTDSQDNVTLFQSTLTVSDPLTYGAPSCSDPGVSLVVDANDPTVVHITVSS